MLSKIRRALCVLLGRGDAGEPLDEDDAHQSQKAVKKGLKKLANEGDVPEALNEVEKNCRFTVLLAAYSIMFLLTPESASMTFENLLGADDDKLFEKLWVDVKPCCGFSSSQYLPLPFSLVSDETKQDCAVSEIERAVPMRHTFCVPRFGAQNAGVSIHCTGP